MSKPIHGWYWKIALPKLTNFVPKDHKRISPRMVNNFCSGLVVVLVVLVIVKSYGYCEKQFYDEK